MIQIAASSRKPLLIIVGGFSIVLAVNMLLVYFALTTWSGLETEHNFVRGLHYNSNIEGARKQRELGWTMKLTSTFQDDKSGVFDVHFSDRDGHPLRALSVKIFAVRPTREGFDREFITKQVTDGSYRTPFRLPLKGVWDLRVVARQGDDDFQGVERIVTP